jgi:hypothetical protein
MSDRQSEGTAALRALTPAKAEVTRLARPVSHKDCVLAG